MGSCGILRSGFNTQPPEGGWTGFNQHIERQNSFNTQPPEGGWFVGVPTRVKKEMFQHTAARRRLADSLLFFIFKLMFQHTAARRRLESGWYKIRRHLQFQHTAARRRLGK